MKILHVNIAGAGGGVEKYLSRLFPELNRVGHENLILYGEKPSWFDKEDSLETFFIEKIASLKCNDIKSKLKSVNQILNDQSPDIVFIHQVLNAKLIGMLTRKMPSIRFMHGHKLICPDGHKFLNTFKKPCPFPLGLMCQLRAYKYRCMPRNPIRGIYSISIAKRNRKYHRYRSHLVVASQFMKEVLIYNGFSIDKISVCPYFSSEPVSENCNNENTEPIVLALGRMVVAKGMDYLVRAFNGLESRARLVIIGDGPELEKLKKLCETLNINQRVSFQGWLNSAECKKWYMRSSLIVVPSIWPEPFGIVGIEAMSFAKPVVAFNSGGVSEWLRDGETGFLVPTGDTEMLKNKIELLLMHPSISEQMGKRGKEYYKEKFTPQGHIKLLKSVFNKVGFR